MPKKICVCVQARLSSARLPGKVLKKIGDINFLSLLIKRLKNSEYLDNIVVATTQEARDDSIADWCKRNNILFFRGSEKDVLDRVVKTHEYMNSDLIVEITGDCPFTDPEIVDLGIETFLANDVDVVTNCGNYLTWPMGQYVQVFPLELLQKINLNIEDPIVHEHVSLYFYENPEKFKLLEIIAPKVWRYPKYRVVLDYQEDYEFHKQVYKDLHPLYGDHFKIGDIINLLENKAELLKINEICEESEPRS